ncbi:hypothetical protein Back2_00350 [Nocardioides baekrokdamisoli]|uniref:Glycoside hydrolase family 5 domain-containing protein n=1 Tax=Nocardioides baekrokdamisoli TaxID=1804624 RepID=A0A3G9IWW7_9ACTN|nr:cellulase family glycosylhydrolase [Nocardioides baekrokdamisoli]BBH15748.1 hypothetical protein Back2_00350 [Nocardioides baekrokdamisoli]
MVSAGNNKDGRALTRRARRLVAFLAAAAAAAVMVQLVATPADGESLTAPATATTVQPRVQAQAVTIKRTGMGVSYGNRLAWMSASQLASTLAEASALHVTWVRTDMAWDDIQPTSATSYRWAGFDAVAKGAHARGINVLPVLAYTPAWARAAHCTTRICPPASVARFAAFARQAAARYSRLGIHTWEIWNEEDSNWFWSNPNPAAYGKLLAATSAAIRAADPHAKIILGGLVMTRQTSRDFSATSFLDTMLRTTPCSAFDAVGSHPYTYPYLASALTTWGTPWEMMTRTKMSLTSVLASHRCAGKKIWVTEFGAPTQGPGNAADGTAAKMWPYATDHVTEAYQATIAANGVAAAVANPSVDTLFWYSNIDLRYGPDPSNFFGLSRLNGTHKPVWTSFQKAVAVVRQ